MKRCDILIIGGGAAGLSAAVCAKRENKNLHIMVIERNERVAKKILATGNGRCNFTNTDISPKYYYGDERFIAAVLKKFPYKAAKSFFSSLGVMVRIDSGRVYPLSNMASSIADALRLYIGETAVKNGEKTVKNGENEVKIETNCEIKSIKKGADGFLAGEYAAKRVIVACGGKAAPQFGTDGGGYSLFTALGHKLIAPRPALAAIRTDTRNIKGLKGVKVRARLKIGAHEDEGELLFTDYGVSGIPAMQLSRFAKRGEYLTIDMLPNLSPAETESALYERIRAFPKREAADIFSGIVNKKIAVPMARYAGIEKMSVKCENFTDKNVRKCAQYLKNLKLEIFGTASFEDAQVTAGGIATDGFNPETMESKLCQGLYAAGEILDCDGMCGGYNLHWAWATGCIAGREAARSLC